MHWNLTIGSAVAHDQIPMLCTLTVFYHFYFVYVLVFVYRLSCFLIFELGVDLVITPFLSIIIVEWHTLQLLKVPELYLPYEPQYGHCTENLAIILPPFLLSNERKP